MEYTALVTLLAFRWVAQLVLARRGTLEGPRDFLTALLFVLYIAFLGLAWSGGAIEPATVIFLAAGVVLRVWALVVLRSAFSHSVEQPSAPAIVTEGPYRFMRNPLLFAYWLELTAFALSFPLSLGANLAAALFAGLVCGWHAHEDNNRLLAQSDAYRSHFRYVRNLGLGLFFPSRARLFSWRRITFDTYAAYAFVGFFAGQIIALGYGVPWLVIAFAVPAAFVGAYLYWRLTSRRSKLRYGFSFFGGMLSATAAAFLVLAALGEISALTIAGLAMAVSAGHAVGRLGCIGHGCCTGAPSPHHQSYFVAYDDPQQRINRVSGTSSTFCAPTVVLEALGQSVIAFAVLLWSRQAAVIWLVGYGALRAVIQSIRAEAGDLTRLIPAALLLSVGCFFGVFLTAEQTPTWLAPTPLQWTLAGCLAVLVAVGFGLRIAPVSPAAETAASR